MRRRRATCVVCVARQGRLSVIMIIFCLVPFDLTDYRPAISIQPESPFHPLRETHLIRFDERLVFGDTSMIVLGVTLLLTPLQLTPCQGVPDAGFMCDSRLLAQLPQFRGSAQVFSGT
jgi:hypothetical protein